MKLLLVIPIALLAVSCGTTWNPVPVDYVFRDLPLANKVEVVLVNDRKYQLCLFPEHWPNQAGKINQASRRVFLLVAGERYPIEEFNTGYCPGGCPMVVYPGEAATASIAYDDFDLPAELRHAPKQLEFPAVAFRCHAGI